MSTRPIAVIGPTGTGKSALALDLAERLGGEIINADAMALYRGMDIGTAKLPVAQRRGIPHHQLDVLGVTQTATVARYQQAAAADVEATDPAVRARWEARLTEVGVADLHAELARRDPDAAAAILATDGRRVVRALEVVELTGRPFAASAPVIGAVPRWDTVIIGLDWDTAILDDRLRRRTDAMFDSGLVGEVRGLIGAGLRDGVTAARALGYAQVLADLDTGGDGSAAREPTFVGTRRYVRRQRSWFRRDPRVHWLDGAAADLLGPAVAAWRHVS